MVRQRGGMPAFPDRPTLPELQDYVARACAERGWDGASDLERYLLFVEEVGELARAIRDRRGLFVEEASERNHAVGEEMADVLSYLLDLANRMGVDLEEAFRAKEAKNDARTWSR